MIARRGDGRIILPGLASAHSHAFQRALRGRAQRSQGSFWSWRGLMYELASKLTPDSIFDISRYAFVELAAHGVTAVGEFHYVHHQADATPYARRTELADAVVRAALEAGIRITLLRVLYARPGLDREPEGAQRRFVDASLDDALRDVDELATTWKDEPRVAVGIAPHSLRAVPLPWVREAAEFAAARSMPFHMHVSEQRREVQECLAEHGARPVALLSDAGVLGERFVAVHATHLDTPEVHALADSFVCLCRTTERDLGDGLARTGDLADAGARLCFGVDSHALSDPFEEARAAELDERSRTERRSIIDAPSLLTAACANGYAAIGMRGRESEDRVELAADDVALVGARDETLDDAVVFGASRSAVSRVLVAGKAIIEDGEHAIANEAREAFERSLP